MKKKNRSKWLALAMSLVLLLTLLPVGALAADAGTDYIFADGHLTILTDAGFDAVGSGVSRGDVTALTLGADVTQVPEMFFYAGPGANNGFPNLATIDVVEGNAVYTAVDNVLFNKGMTELMWYPNKREGTVYRVPDGVTNLWRSAFPNRNRMSGCPLKTLIFPASIRDLGGEIIQMCPLDAWYFLGEPPPYSFGRFVCWDYGTNVFNFYIPEGSEEAYRTIVNNAQDSHSDPFTLNIYPFPYEFNAQTGHLVVRSDDALALIGKLLPLDEVKSVFLAEGVTTVPDMAFAGAANLESVSYGSTLTSIGDAAFYDCPKLTAFHLGASVTDVGLMAFDSSDNMTQFTVDSNSNHFSARDGVLFDKAGTTLIKYPMGKTDAAYTVPDGVTTIADGAFYTDRDSGGLALKSITFPASLTDIGTGARAVSLSSLTSLTFQGAAPPTVAMKINMADNGKIYVPAEAVTAYTDYLKNPAAMKVPATVTIEAIAYDFDPATGHLNVYTNAGTTSWRDDSAIVGTGAPNYAAVKSVKIGPNVTTIGAGAFNGTDIETLHIPKTVTTLPQTDFVAGCERLASFSVEEGSTDFLARDGVLYALDGDPGLLRVPPGKTGALTVAADVGGFATNYVFADCKKIASVSFLGDTPISGFGSALFAGANSGLVIHAPNASYKTWADTADCPDVLYLPGPVQNLAKQSLGSTTAVIKWDAPSDPGGDAALTGYRVERRATADGAVVETLNVPAAQTYCELTGLEPNTSYYLRVYAVNGRGASDYGEITATTSPSWDGSWVGVNDGDTLYLPADLKPGVYTIPDGWGNSLTIDGQGNSYDGVSFVVGESHTLGDLDLTLKDVDLTVADGAPVSFSTVGNLFVSGAVSLTGGDYGLKNVWNLEVPAGSELSVTGGTGILAEGADPSWTVNGALTVTGRSGPAVAGEYSCSLLGNGTARFEGATHGLVGNYAVNGAPTLSVLGKSGCGVDGGLTLNNASAKVTVAGSAGAVGGSTGGSAQDSLTEAVVGDPAKSPMDADVKTTYLYPGGGIAEFDPGYNHGAGALTLTDVTLTAPLVFSSFGNVPKLTIHGDNTVSTAGHALTPPEASLQLAGGSSLTLENTSGGDAIAPGFDMHVAVQTGQFLQIKSSRGVKLYGVSMPNMDLLNPGEFAGLPRVAFSYEATPPAGTYLLSTINATAEKSAYAVGETVTLTAPGTQPLLDWSVSTLSNIGTAGSPLDPNTLDGWTVDDDRRTVSFKMPAKHLRVEAMLDTETGGGTGGPIVSSYTVTYKANYPGGPGDVRDGGHGYNSTVTAKPASTFDPPAGKTFAGWSESAEGPVKYRAGETFKMPAKDLSLYAVWREGGPQPGLNKTEHIAYLTGYPDGTVRPEGNITREETAMLFYRLLDDETREYYETTEHPFGDVEAGRWSETAIATLHAAGIVEGRSGTRFDPGASITRAEFAAIAARFDPGEYTGADRFPDIGSHWARELINLAAEKGWVQGTPTGLFEPDQPITRAEAAALINRVLERAPETAADLLSGMKTWPDNEDPTAWYYLDLQEAGNGHEYERKEDGVHEKWTKLI